MWLDGWIRRSIAACASRRSSFWRLSPISRTLARIRYDHFAPQLTQQAADPRRMHPDFQCDPTAWHRAEDFLQHFCTRPHSLLELYLTHFIQHAVLTVAISQIQSDGQFLRRNIPALRCCSGASLLHCRSPFYLCLEHLDNLGAYSIPSGDRPSHPIWLRQRTIQSRI